MSINASIAVLATDSAFAQAVSHRIGGIRLFSQRASAAPNIADSSITFGESVNLIAVPAQPDLFDPPQLGSFLAWGADIALLTVNSASGIDGKTIQLAQEVAQHHPLMVAITGLNAPTSNFDETLAVLSRVMDFRHHAVALTLPVMHDSETGEDSEVGGILDLVELEIRVVGPEDSITAHSLEQTHFDLIDSHLEALTTAVVVTSTDENLIHSILANGFESGDQLREQLLSATARREIIPVFAIEDSIGIVELVEFAADLELELWLPSRVLPHDFLATSLGEGLARVWRGEITTGEYFADSAAVHVTEIYGLDGKARSHAHAGEIIRIHTEPVLDAGRVISEMKSTPLVIDHASE